MLGLPSRVGAVDADSMIPGSTAIRQKPISALSLAPAERKLDGAAFLDVGPAGQGE
jgi:hypothetical protein